MIQAPFIRVFERIQILPDWPEGFVTYHFEDDRGKGKEPYLSSDAISVTDKVVYEGTMNPLVRFMPFVQPKYLTRRFGFFFQMIPWAIKNDHKILYQSLALRDCNGGSMFVDRSKNPLQSAALYGDVAYEETGEVKSILHTNDSNRIKEYMFSVFKPSQLESLHNKMKKEEEKEYVS